MREKYRANPFNLIRTTFLCLARLTRHPGSEFRRGSLLFSLPALKEMLKAKKRPKRLISSLICLASREDSSGVNPA